MPWAVHYVSRLADTQQVLVDTRDEGGDDPVPLVAGRGVGPVYVAKIIGTHENIHPSLLQPNRTECSQM